MDQLGSHPCLIVVLLGRCPHLQKVVQADRWHLFLQKWDRSGMEHYRYPLMVVVVVEEAVVAVVAAVVVVVVAVELEAHNKVEEERNE